MPPLVDEQSPPLDNDLLQASERAIEARLTPQTKQTYDRIVLAGMQVAIKGGETGILRNLRNQPDPVKACATGAVNLAFMMLKSQNPHPTDQMLAATVYASYTLMLQALNVAAKMKLVEITGGEGGTIDRASRIATNQISALTHLTPQKWDTAASKVHSITQNPEQMQQIRLKIGADRDPRAPTPTLPSITPPTEDASEPA